MSKRWDQLTWRQRAFALFKQIDANTRALAKLASAILYLGDAGCEVTSEAPDLFVATRTVYRERCNLRAALENELAAGRAEKQAKQAVQTSAGRGS